jgi:LPXTG-site transpeptidase (sortase) family protein
MPGRIGNSVFAGHRVTHTHPFLDLDLLANGDKIIFDMPYGTFTYRVFKHIIVPATDVTSTAVGSVTVTTTLPPLTVTGSVQARAWR